MSCPKVVEEHVLILLPRVSCESRGSREPRRLPVHLPPPPTPQEAAAALADVIQRGGPNLRLRHSSSQSHSVALKHNLSVLGKYARNTKPLRVTIVQPEGENRIKHPTIKHVYIMHPESHMNNCLL